MISPQAGSNCAAKKSSPVVMDEFVIKNLFKTIKIFGFTLPGVAGTFKISWDNCAIMLAVSAYNISDNIT